MYFQINKLKCRSLSKFIKLGLLYLFVNYSNLILSQQFPIISICDENNICTCERKDSLKHLNKKQVKQILDTLQSNSIKDTAFLACCYHQLSVSSYYLKDDLIESLNFNKKAEQLRIKSNDGLLWRTYLNTGINYYDLDEYKLANRYLLKAISIKGIKESLDSITILRTLGNCYTYLGDFEKGIEYGKSATEIKADVDIEHINYAKNDLAATLIETNETQKIELGIQYSKQVINDSEDQDNEILALINLARAYELLKKNDQALKYYKKGVSLSQNDTVNQGIILNNIGTLHIDKYTIKEGAIETLKNALNLYHSYYDANYNYNYAAPHENLGDNYATIQQFGTALQHYQKALINLTNNFRNQNIFKNPKPNPKDTALFIYSNPDMIRVLHLKATAAFKYYQQNKEEKYLTLANQTYQTAFDFHGQLQKDISNSQIYPIAY